MGLYRLENAVMPYAWGSRSALATLRGDAPSATPEAELWIGAHPKAPSRILGGVSLADHIAGKPTRCLGDGPAARFGGELPFLLKLLAADQPLSLQVHPNEAQAIEGFAREEAAGIPRESPQRNYRDPHHKPEIICAISEFEALAGLRPHVDIANLFERLGVAPLRQFVSPLRGNASCLALRGLFEFLFDLDKSTLGLVLEEVRAACVRLRQFRDPESRHLGWSLTLNSAYPGDVGAIIALLLNHIQLAPGQAIYLAPGQLHAYLHGFGVELMACSDNVIRGGLTSKNVDAAELLRVLEFDGVRATPLARVPEGPDTVYYDVEVPEFRLSALRLRSGSSFEHDVRGPEALVCIEGNVTLTASGHPLTITPGQAAFCEAATSTYTIRGSGLAYRASVGAVL